MPWAESSRHLLFVLIGSGRRIRTLTYGVRVRCATFTQSRCVLTNKNYYTRFSLFVKYKMEIFQKNFPHEKNR